MNLLLLSGESFYNKEWVERVEESLKDLFETTKILYYDHWKTGQNSIDFENEYRKLPNFVAGLDDYVIFAKSIGTALAAKGIFERILTPKKCIFLGPAWFLAEDWIDDFSIPTIFVTKTADPVMPADKLRDLLSRHRVQNYQFVELPGDNHKYDDLEKIKELVLEFTK